MAELKPCPFCGGEADIRLDSELQIYFVIVCTKCPTNVGRMWYSKKKDAIEAWNRRAGDA